MKEVIKLDTVDQYNRLFGLETLHPLVSVVNLSGSHQISNAFHDELWGVCPFPEKRQMRRHPLWPADLRLSGRNGHQLCPGTGG